MPDFTEEISRKYNRFARWYDFAEAVPEFGVRQLRQQLIRRVSGKVLEVAVGTGKNFSYYPANCQLTAVDVSREMLKVARKRAAKLPINVSFLLADAEALPFGSQSFDTVVSSLSSCTFPKPVSALHEMTRVCKPGGRILLLEHGRSNWPRLARFQDRHAGQFAKPLGCHWSREPQELARQAGFKILDGQRSFFGVFQVIEAMP